MRGEWLIKRLYHEGEHCLPAREAQVARERAQIVEEGALQGVVSEFGKNRTLSRVATLVMRGVLERVDVRLTYAPTGRQTREVKPSE